MFSSGCVGVGSAASGRSVRSGSGRVGSGLVYSGALPCPGVGSKRTQPTPSKYSSGQAWALWVPTWKEPSACRVPGVKPTTTWAGMSSVRAIVAMVKAKCTQNPSRRLRKLTMASAPLPESTVVS